ncbi:MAG: response regulator [Nitrospinae bacterium]|nr:response regulator [Nitrospinota bacterium]
MFFNIAMDTQEFLNKLSTLKVLIVDDNFNMIKTIEHMLEAFCSFKKKSNSIYKATDGTRAMSILKQQSPNAFPHIDLVLLDWNMPRVPGIEVIRSIRASHEPFIKNVPVIMVTAEARAKDVHEAIHEGVDSYLIKPILLKDLNARVNSALKYYWSGQPMLRYKNMRSEVRYCTLYCKMKVKVAYVNEYSEEADVINISENGLRVVLKKPRHAINKASNMPEAVSILFKEFHVISSELHEVAVMTIPQEVEEGTENIELSLCFKYGFDSELIHNHWHTWVNEVKKKELSYRGMQT